MDGILGRKETGANTWGSRLRISPVDQAAKNNAQAAKGSEASERLTSDTVTLSTVRSAVDTAHEAINAINKVREQQLALANDAQNTAQGERTTQLNTELEAMQTEIERISASATYNGQNVLNGALYASPEGQDEGMFAIAIPDQRQLSQDPGVTLTTQEDAAAAYSALYENVGSTENMITATGSSLGKSNQLIEDSIEPPAESVRNINQAEALAKKIKDNISQFVADGENSQSLVEISLLDPEKVKDLLK